MKSKKDFTLRFSRFYGVFMGLFFVVCLASVMYAETKSQEPELFGVLENDLLAEPNQQAPGLSFQNDLLVAKIPTTLMERRLWQVRTNAFKENETNQNRDQLQQIIRQVSSIQFKPKPQAQAPSAELIVESLSKNEPNETVSDVVIPHEQETENKPAKGHISEQTRQRIENMLQQPEQMKSPLELAEILFNSGCLKEAAACYRQALGHIREEETNPLQDKAWILLQLGNCLQNENPQAALENYRAVIVECPDSPWVPLAKAKSELANWYLQDQPKTLIHNALPSVD